MDWYFVYNRNEPHIQVTNHMKKTYFCSLVSHMTPYEGKNHLKNV